MKHSLKMHLARLSAGAMLATTLAGAALGLQSAASFASGPCNPGTEITVANSPVPSSDFCDMSVTADITPGTLSFNNTASVSVSGTFSNAAQSLPFTFTNVVTDDRGGTDGWKLQAALSGLTGLTLSLDSDSTTCVGVNCAGTTFTAVPNLTANTTFLKTNGAALENGVYTSTIGGNVNVPGGTASGTYTGTVTITLVNTNS